MRSSSVVIQMETFIVIEGMTISANRYGVENPIPFRIPSVAAPQPKSVSGPRNNPSGAKKCKRNTDHQCIVRNYISKQRIKIRNTKFCCFIEHRNHKQKSNQRCCINYTIIKNLYSAHGRHPGKISVFHKLPVHKNFQ